MMFSKENIYSLFSIPTAHLLVKQDFACSGSVPLTTLKKEGTLLRENKYSLLRMDSDEMMIGSSWAIPN
jgi:hypothetical protein